MRRRLLLCGAALACLAAAAFAALLANDVLAWRSAFDAAPAQSGGVPGASGAVLPFHVARNLLGVQDDVAFRQAIVLFREGYSGIPSQDQSPGGTDSRAEAEAALERVLRSEGDGPRAALATNLLGVLEMVDATAGQSPDSVNRAIVEFQNAIRLDPTNADAKANLEIALGLAPPDSPFRSQHRASNGKRRGGASQSSAGRGY